ncbi:lytic transglycosylase domain-containing protein [Marinibacterium profundimaris]|uniref:Lytic murein transglycosylase n=1 Tax=Marinibacterium profundimaris TaxID=1679460 RepID=A0A225NDW1_9RHOB|nr:lytic transglycosylase domain-containing protein [Marinibacterium profundimaris]OWU70398.1 lytic murein transglycosylase [Marinibacterium profundimaris]
MNAIRMMASCLACALAVEAAAQDGGGAPAPFPEFSAKRVKPPKPGTSRRITVQIDPDATPARPAAPPPAAAEIPVAAVAPGSRRVGGSYDWFWDRISPALADTGPGRLQSALAAIAAAGPVAAPRLQNLSDIASARAIPILTSTVGTRVSPALVLAVIAVESAGRADAVSKAGAQGLMQLMPETAREFGVADSLVPEQNIAGGVRYLDWLMTEFDADPILVLAGYNAGPGSVRTHGGVPPFPETRDYVPKVLAAFQVAKALCITPPELISDGCVFATSN